MSTLDEVKRYPMTAQNFDIARHVGTDPRQVTVTVVKDIDYDMLAADNARNLANNTALYSSLERVIKERDRLQSECEALKKAAKELTDAIMDIPETALLALDEDPHPPSWLSVLAERLRGLLSLSEP